MSHYRSIEVIITPKDFHMVGDGFRVMNYFPAHLQNLARLSPFFLLDYNPAYEFPSTNQLRGVGPHPHRGFETVTIAYQGAVEHHDSVGNRGVINPGDVQWMTAGSGVLHSEYHKKEFARSGGTFQMVQLWVNLPRAHKMIAPKYQTLLNEKIPVTALPNNAGTLRLIAGEYAEKKGAANTFTPVNIWDLQLQANNTIVIDAIPAEFNTALLILEGEVEIDKQPAQANDLVIFKNDHPSFSITSKNQNAKALLLSGEPIDEPIAHYGPFVMNTEAELQTALHDFKSGKFGYLEE